MAVRKSKVQAAPYDAGVAGRQKSEAYDGSATRTSTARALRCQRGYLAANYDRILAQSLKLLRCQFHKMYDVKKVRNRDGATSPGPKPATRALNLECDIAFSFRRRTPAACQSSFSRRFASWRGVSPINSNQPTSPESAAGPDRPRRWGAPDCPGPSRDRWPQGIRSATVSPCREHPPFPAAVKPYITNFLGPRK
jgi:hypothetical protein